MMNETLKKVYNLLEVKCEPVKHKGGDWFLLTHQGKKFGNYCSSEELAWMMAPSLERLALALITALGKVGAVMTESAFEMPLVQASMMAPTPLDGHIVWYYGDYQAIGETYQEAVATLFVKVCKAGLIDPKTVVLP